MSGRADRSGVPLHVSGVRFTPSPPELEEQGFLGQASLVLDHGPVLAGIEVWRTVAGDRVLSFPRPKTATGERHYFIRSLSNKVRRRIEQQVFEYFDLEQGAAS